MFARGCYGFHYGRRETYPVSLQKGKTLFRLFHCFPAPRIVRRPCPRVIPRVLVKLGRLKGVIYSSDRGEQNCPKTYIHFMEEPPLLVSDTRGRQLYIIGGRYRVTRRGIEG